MFQGPGAFDFCDDERVVPHRRRGLPDGDDVRGALDEGLADRVHPLFGCKFQPFAVVLGEGADPEVDAGQVETLVGAQFPADDDPAEDLLSFDPHGFELDEAVVQEQGIARS